MTPQEAIARLKRDDPNPAFFIEVMRGHAKQYLPGLVDAVCDLALHALSTDPTRAALERVRKEATIVRRGDAGSVIARSDIVEAIDRELASLTDPVAQPAEPAPTVAEKAEAEVARLTKVVEKVKEATK